MGAGGGGRNVTSLKWSPLITFDNFHDPPALCLHFPSGPSFESFQSFQWSPLGSQLRLIPLLFPYPPPPPPAINNDRSLKRFQSRTWFCPLIMQASEKLVRSQMRLLPARLTKGWHFRESASSALTSVYTFLFYKDRRTSKGHVRHAAKSEAL